MTTKPDTSSSAFEKYFLVIIGLPIFFWACAFPFIKIGLEFLSPINLTIMRLMLVCVVFLLIIGLKPKKFSNIQKADIPKFFLLGFFGVVVYHLGLNYGELFISASAASLIIATIPVFVVILAIIFLKEKITKWILLGIVLSMVGVIVISLLGTPEASFEIEYVSAAFAVLVAAVVGAGYTIAGKKMLGRYNALSLTVYAFLFGCLGLLPFVGESLVTEVYSMAIQGWFAVVFLALFPTVIGYVFWYVALEIRTASQVSVYLYFVPVLSTIISCLFFDEQITFFFIVGGILVILGLAIVNKKQNMKVHQ